MHPAGIKIPRQDPSRANWNQRHAEESRQGFVLGWRLLFSAGVLRGKSLSGPVEVEQVVGSPISNIMEWRAEMEIKEELTISIVWDK